MSIIITNISLQNSPEIGKNRYQLRINKRVICEFEHDRKIDGLAQCLRDAANAVDNVTTKNQNDFIWLLKSNVNYES